MMIRHALVLASLAGLSAAPASAQTPADSRYTRLFEDCVERASEDEPVIYSTCPGEKDWPVNLVLGEHGAAVAFSDRGVEQQWSQNPPRDGSFLGLGPILEWRIDTRTDEAFATILRWSWERWNETGDGTDPAAQYLVVSALRPEGETGACHVAYVEARMQPGANQIARDAADYLAPGWQCGVDEPVIFDQDSAYDVITIFAQRRPGH